MFFSHHRLVRHAVHHSLVPLSLLIKLGIFSVFRLGFCGWVIIVLAYCQSPVHIRNPGVHAFSTDSLTIADGVLRSREGPFHQSVASAHIANAVLIGDCLCKWFRDIPSFLPLAWYPYRQLDPLAVFALFGLHRVCSFWLRQIILLKCRASRNCFAYGFHV